VRVHVKDACGIVCHAKVRAPDECELASRFAIIGRHFEVDPLRCPTCHGAMRIVAFITQTSVIDQILTHLRTRASRAAHAGPRSPPSTRAPASRGPARTPRSSADAAPVI
jgi:hypothetical protein